MAGAKVNKMKIHSSRVLAALAAVTLGAFASADELIQNGNFGVTTGSLDHWTVAGDIFNPGNGSTTHDFAFASSQHSHSTRFSADMGIENFTGSTYTSQLSQLFAAAPTSGVASFTAWGYSFDQDVEAKLYYSDSTTSKGTMTFNHAGVQGNDPERGWQQWDLKSLLVPGKTLYGITFTVESGGFNKGNDVFLDDVSLQARPVPEPAPIAALAVGALGLLGRRRKAAR